MHWLMIVYLDNKMIEPKESLVRKGDILKIKCMTAAEARWSHEESQLKDNVLVLSDTSILLTNIQFYNTGVYTCLGTDDKGNEIIAKSLVKMKGNYNTSNVPF